MGETTTHEEDVSREEAAELLQELAHEVRNGPRMDAKVGNKLLTLHPSSVLEYEIAVNERSPMLGGDREELTVTLEWEVEADDG